MSHLKRLMITTTLSGGICCLSFSQAHAATNTTLELNIQPAQCTADTVATGLQAAFAINPKECIQMLRHDTSKQANFDGSVIYRGAKTPTFHVDSTQSKSASFQPKTTAPHPHSLPILQFDSQSLTSAGLGIIVIISADILAFNMRYTQMAWRHATRAVRRVLSVFTI